MSVWSMNILREVSRCLPQSLQPGTGLVP